MKYLLNLTRYGILSLIAFVSIFPFIWMLIGATNTSADIIKGKVSFGDQLLANFATLSETVDLPLVAWNSAKIAGISVFFSLLLCSMAGYGFEIFRSKARERIYATLLLTMMIPFAALMIPLFMMFAKAGLLDTHFAVVLPTLATAFIIFYFRQTTKAFPSELRDAARVDGLKEWEIYLFVYMPVMRSTFAAAFIITFMFAWNNYLWPLIVLQSNDTKTLTLVISSIAQGYYPDYAIVMVATILATLPTILVFFLMQRQFVQGMLGSVK
ncbi:carbohydrate ABC transporter permease [uncultured Cohaesibacter sp.]|uniref:carbohydrate ABC transporter permease n=1 Tax=uncultured Cohaesibacter sp. TaxID=1002546 RepID=UPI00293096ED|nr:carbohydrate ABC transporter permease [uncultured Cohaesibacter sp.]